jgi:GGDEF domain-containing protein
MNLPKQTGEAGASDVTPGYDRVTGLPNRTLFDSRVKELLEEVGNDEKALGILLLHVDNYSEIHNACDGLVSPLIGAIAGRIQRLLGPDEYLARIRHHAFAVLLNPAVAADRAERIRRAFGASFQLDQNNVIVKISAGIQTISSAPETADYLLLPPLPIHSSSQQKGLLHERGLLTGTRMGPFVITSVQRNLRETYGARDIWTKRDVTIQVLNRLAGKHQEFANELQHGSNTAGIVSHPNVIELIEVRAFHGRWYIVMEKLKGETLRETFRKHRMRLNQVAGYVTQIAQGLRALHESKIVHGDLTPENILITEDHQIKLLYFGSNRFFQLDHPDLPESPPSPQLDGQFGRIRYLSPEHVLGKPVDERSDIFSFGSLCYEMVCGKPAFPGENTVDVLNSILKIQPALLYSTEVSNAFLPVLAKCLSKSPADRFETATELALAIKCTLQNDTPS